VSGPETQPPLPQVHLLGNLGKREGDEVFLLSLLYYTHRKSQGLHYASGWLLAGSHHNGAV
jgi:hypothetical protein